MDLFLIAPINRTGEVNCWGSTGLQACKQRDQAEDRQGLEEEIEA